MSEHSDQAEPKRAEEHPDEPGQPGGHDTSQPGTSSGPAACGHEPLSERQVPWRESVPRRPERRVSKPPSPSSHLQERAPSEAGPAEQHPPTGDSGVESVQARPPTPGPTPAPQPPWERQVSKPPPEASASSPSGEQPTPYTRRYEMSPPQTGREQGSAQPVLHTTPLWRLLGVILAFGGLGLAGYGLNVVGHIDDAATILSVTIVYTIGFWARRQRRDLADRLGPFSKIGIAIVESDDEIRAWVARRTLLAGVLVAALAGVGIAVLKAAIEAALGWLASPWLAGALGCLAGALVVAPDLWQGFRDAIRKGPR